MGPRLIFGISFMTVRTVVWLISRQKFVNRINIFIKKETVLLIFEFFLHKNFAYIIFEKTLMKSLIYGCFVT
jgi:hypothetical protein